MALEFYFIHFVTFCNVDLLPFFLGPLSGSLLLPRMMGGGCTVQCRLKMLFTLNMGCIQWTLNEQICQIFLPASDPFFTPFMLPPDKVINTEGFRLSLPGKLHSTGIMLRLWTSDLCYYGDGLIPVEVLIFRYKWTKKTILEVQSHILYV